MKLSPSISRADSATCLALAASLATLGLVAALPAKAADLSSQIASQEPATFDDRWSFAAGLYG